MFGILTSLFCGIQTLMREQPSQTDSVLRLSMPPQYRMVTANPHEWQDYLRTLTPGLKQQHTRVRQGRIKLFGAPRQLKHFGPLFQAVFISGGGYYPPD